MTKKNKLALDTAGTGDTLALEDSSVGSLNKGQGTPWKLWLVGLNACALLSGIAGAALIWLLSLPPAPECDKLTNFSSERMQLHCIEAAAESGELRDLLVGLDALEAWTPNRPLYSVAQTLTDDWSEQIFYAAQQRVQENDVDGALRMLAKIPTNSSVYMEAQDFAAQWTGIAQQGAVIVQQAEAAMQAQDWLTASEKIQELERMPQDYWRTEQAMVLSQRVWQERQGRKVQQEALQAQSGALADVVKAVEMVSTIGATTYAYQDLQPILNQWGSLLLDAGRIHWQAAEFEAAIALADQAKTIPSLTHEATHLQQLVEARQLAVLTDSKWQTSPQDVVRLMEAIAAVEAIPSDSRFFAQAEDSRLSWSQQLDDLQRLQMAQALANLGVEETYRVAIAQAQQISPNRLRRQQAQTLIAHWRSEIERLEDAPLLVQARQAAAGGDIPQLRQAIVQARQIPLGRALRGEAQAAIYEWVAQIQRIEDAPLLNLARTQAQQGNLQQAIQTASAIQSGRASHIEAQASVQQWRNRIRQAEQARQRQAEQRRREAIATAEAAAKPEPSVAVETPAPAARRPAPAPRPVAPVAPAPAPVAPPPVAAPSPATPAEPLQEAVEPQYAPMQPASRREVPAPVAPPAPVQAEPVSPAVPTTSQPLSQTGATGAELL
ncbi:hypothetical protein [Vacuolonema iberomarrocanum]|uniref:hypothetical protein n=1 Tax=Vacuolonema iberomarrocanum TaxID=3454632 RepID=UPI0019DE9DE2|nr:hypothetical protein [filamentous cyanobacterium LEGE 07170]